jgi:hypothetical protein
MYHLPCSRRAPTRGIRNCKILMLYYAAVPQCSHVSGTEVATGEDDDGREVAAHPPVEADMLDEGALPEPRQTDDRKHTVWPEQEVEDGFLLHLPAEHDLVKDQVGTVRLAADARVSLQEQGELLHGTYQHLKAMEHLLHLLHSLSIDPQVLVAGNRERGEKLGWTESWQGNSDATTHIVVFSMASVPDGVEHVMALVHALSEHLQLTKHGLVCDVPPLSFLDGGVNPEQHALQLLPCFFHLGASVHLYRNGQGSTDEIARDCREKWLHCWTLVLLGGDAGRCNGEWRKGLELLTSLHTKSPAQD